MTGEDEHSGQFLRPKSRSKLSPTDAPSVLVAEDNPDLQWRLARTLTIEGYRVVGASSAAGALALLEQWSVDVAVIGERVLAACGSELIFGRLRRLRPNLPIIVVANTSRKSGVSAARRPYDLDSTLAPVILHPPIQPENVRAALTRALRQGGEASGLLTAAPAG